jgi:hypothetical protein
MSDSNIPEFIQRIQNERAELSIKLANLNKFFETDIYSDLSSYQQELLVQQSDAMSEYLEILDLRIANELQILKDNANA